MNTGKPPRNLRPAAKIKQSISEVKRITGASSRAVRALRRSATRLPLIAVATAFFLLVSSLENYTFSRGNLTTAFAETIGTFAADCSTPKTSFNVGDAVCAKVNGAPLPGPIIFGGFRQRRIQWVAPDGRVAQQTDVTSDPQNDSYTVPTEGIFSQLGTWSVRTIDNSSSVFASARFAVSSPQAPAVDLSVVTSAGANESHVAAGANLSFTIFLTNFGPDDAQNVALTDTVPGSTTFVSMTQNSGSAFSCANPSGGGTGSSTCTIATLPANATAVFTLVVNVDAGAADGTIITSSSSVTSSTNELHQGDNTSSADVTVSGAASAGCSLNCSPDLTRDNDANQCTAVVSYSTPTTVGNCGSAPDNVVTCNPPSGSTFPIGATTVNCSTQSGGVCSFTVSVHDTRTPVQPTISCPGDQSVAESSAGSGEATVNYPAPITTGNCVSTVCEPPSGSSFGVGTTTVNCTGTDSSNVAVTCSFTVTVTSGAACTLTCSGDVTVAAPSGQCNAVVTYTSPSTSGNCGTVTCSPASGSTFAVGSTTVTCNSSQGASCDFTVSVTGASPPTITTCATNKTVTANAACEGVIPNLIPEVVATGCGVTLSQSPAAGSIVDPGSITVTITAENTAGEVTCTAIVNVVESTPPTITSCAAGVSASANANCQAAVPNVTGGVTATDNCTAPEFLTVTQSPAAGTLVGVGTTTITITVKDASNNSATCTTTLTVADTTPPAAVCKNITVALDATGNASITAAQIDNGSSDNCGIVSRTASPSAFTCANKGANSVTLTVRDAANNSATCTATVTVIDNIPPTITCTADINVEFNPAVGGAVVTYTTPVGADNCPGATTVQTTGLASGATFPLGTTTNTFTVTDGAGLTATCTFKVTVALTSIIGLDSVSITGSSLVDSYSSAGGYSATHGSLADVVSNGTITLGNSGKVSGNVRSTRAGINLSGASQVTGNATAGTTVSISGAATVGGTTTNNSLAPLFTLPAVVACGPPYSPNSGISGTYSYNASTGDLSLSGVNIATLANGAYCFHNVTLTNTAQLKVNGPVVIKLTGTLNVSGATSLPNTTGIPSNLVILSSYSGSNGVTFGNSASLQLVVYAPQTNVSISGAAPLFGTVAGKTVTLSNSGMIHYDTTLLSIWPGLWPLILGQ